MIGFLAPALLALAVAAAVPILLHLLQRQQGRRVVFPAIRYLRLAEREHARRIRLRQLLLLLLRVAAVMALAFAAARPFLRGGQGEHRPTAVVVVLDNSLSASLVRGDRRLLDELKGLALAATDAAGPDDRFWVIRAAEPWAAAPPGDARAAADLIRGVAPVPAGADLPAALERARGLLGAGADGRVGEIHLLTDGQATEFAGTDAGAGEDDAGPPVLVVAPDRDPPANLGVAAVSLEGGLAPRAGQRVSVGVALAGGRDSTGLRLLAHDTLRAVGRGAAGSVALLMLPAQPEGVLEGRAELEADELRADDRRHYVARVLPPAAVAVVGEAPFVEGALDILADGGRVRRAPARSADVVVSVGGAGLPTRPGAAVIALPPADPVALPALNRALAEAGVPWRVEAQGEAAGDRADAPADPELAALLADVELRTPYRLRAEGDVDAAEVRVRLAGGDPWAVGGALPDGARYLLVAGPLDGREGDVAATAAMVPLVDRLVAGWASAIPEGADLAPGAWVPLPGRADAVVGPEGERIGVEGGAPFRVPPAPGVYRVLAGDSLLGAFAVNPPPRESELTRLDERALRSALGGEARVVAKDDWSREIFRARRGREAWRLAALAALLLLLAEMLVAAGG
ncbi:MAG: VWA domain-containing protein, partial [Gemmatimonadota bacterium]